METSPLWRRRYGVPEPVRIIIWSFSVDVAVGASILSHRFLVAFGGTLIPLLSTVSVSLAKMVAVAVTVLVVRMSVAVSKSPDTAEAVLKIPERRNVSVPGLPEVAVQLAGFFMLSINCS